MRSELLLRRIVSATCLLCVLFLGNVVAAVPAGIPCDYNNNGICDAADVVLWRNGGPLENDSTPGVQPHDYDVWKEGYGRTSGSGSISLGNDVVAVPSLSCDYNENGICDAADYSVWREGLGTRYSIHDYHVWVEGFGKSAGSGAIFAAPNGVAAPEPASATLLLLTVAGAAMISRRGTR